MYYERYNNHYVVRNQDSSIYAHCDTVVECKKEIEEEKDMNIWSRDEERDTVLGGNTDPQYYFSLMSKDELSVEELQTTATWISSIDETLYLQAQIDHKEEIDLIFNRLNEEFDKRTKPAFLKYFKMLVYTNQHFINLDICDDVYFRRYSLLDIAGYKDEELLTLAIAADEITRFTLLTSSVVEFILNTQNLSSQTLQGEHINTERYNKFIKSLLTEEEKDIYI